MISKSEIKQVRSLHQKKYRDELKLFIAEGPKVVNDLLRSDFKVKALFSTDKTFAVSKQEVVVISEKDMGQISTLTTPNSVLAIFEMNHRPLNKSILNDQLVIALDDIRDPGNLGTIIRIADWFGITTILCSESCVDSYNPKVVQATMGSLGRVQVHYLKLESVLKDSKNVYGTVLNGKNIYKEKLSPNGIILLGNESRGISEDLMSTINYKISIPAYSSGADSLNAAVACAVICSEFKRREE